MTLGPLWRMGLSKVISADKKDPMGKQTGTVTSLSTPRCRRAWPSASQTTGRTVYRLAVVTTSSGVGYPSFIQACLIRPIRRLKREG